jgi:hypothetical protein
MAKVYKRMGVENNCFHLTLLQPELQGIDPHSKLLSEEIKVKIYTECFHNPWYFFREVVRIPPQSGTEPVQFIANRGNLSLIWSFYMGIDYLLIQPRQTGKSVSTDCLMVNLLFVSCTNTTINLLTKDNALRTANVERLKRIRDLLPSYLYVKDKKDSDNSIEVTYNTRGNKYRTAVAQSSEAAALNVGRGGTSPINQIDEGPFIRHVGTSIPALLASGTAAREEAKRKGVPYGTIFTTTAGKIDDRDGGYMYKIYSGATVWTERIYDVKTKEDAHVLVSKNCTGAMTLINGTFSHRQLGKSDDWLRTALKGSGATGEEADRDFFNRWTRGSLKSPLNNKLNGAIRESVKEPTHLEITKEGYIVRWYVPKDQIDYYMEHNNVVMGLDTSEAVGRDFIALVGISVLDGGVVFVSPINETNLITYCMFLSDFMIKYKKTVLVVEKKSTGQTITDSLLLSLPNAGEDPFKRIFNRVIDESDDRQRDLLEIRQPMGRRTDDVYVKFKKEFGFNTTGASRELLYSRVIQNAASNSGHLVHDDTLSGEITSLVTKNGRIDHSASGNDDCVIAWLLAHWFLMYGKHLKYYDIKENSALSHATGEAKRLTPEELYVRSEIDKIKTYIESVKEELAACSDQIKIALMENRLVRATEYLTKLGGRQIINADSLISEARDERRKRNGKTKPLAKAQERLTPSWW